MRNRILTLTLITGFLSFNFLYAQVPTLGLLDKSSDVTNAYTLLCPYNQNDFYLIDNCGLEVRKWTSQYKGLGAYLLPNGDVLRTGIDPNAYFGNPGYHGILEIYGFNGALKWQYKISNDSVVLHHDVEYLPNGNILAIAWQRLDRDEIRNLGRDSSEDILAMEIWEEVIYEIKPKGFNGADIVWEWHTKDHTIQNYNSTLSNYGNPSSHPELIDINYAKEGVGHPADWLHFNSIDFNPLTNQILLSCLTFGEIYIIDHSTTTGQAAGHFGGNSGMGGDLIFRWGNPQAYGAGTQNDQILTRQHDPNWIETGTYKGMIMIFNNNPPRGYSSVEIISPTILGGIYQKNTSGAYLPNSPSVSFSIGDNFFSAVMSNASILTGTRVVTCEATKGRITEYDISTQSVKWRYINPLAIGGALSQGATPTNNTLFKAHRYLSTYSAFTGKNLSTASPLEVNPYNSACWFNEVEDTTKGDTTVNDSSQTSIAQMSSSFNGIYPNPAVNTIEFVKDLAYDQIVLSNQQGQVVCIIEDHAGGSLNISALSPGLYYVELRQSGKTERLKFIKSTGRP